MSNSSIDHHFPESGLWKGIFWAVLLAIGAGGWFLSKEQKGSKEERESEQDTLKKVESR